jgi:hypothetical protein
VVAAKSQPSANIASTRVSVVSTAHAASNDTVTRAISAATPSAKASVLPTIKVKPIKVHPGGSSSSPRVVFTYKTTKPTTGHKKTIIVTIVETPSPSTSPSGHHEDNGDQGEHHGSHSTNPSASPSTHGGGDD